MTTNPNTLNSRKGIGGRPKGSPPCSEPGCQERSQGLGLCSRHYQQLPEQVEWYRVYREKQKIQRRLDNPRNCSVCDEPIGTDKRTSAVTCSEECRQERRGARSTASKRGVPIEDILFLKRAMPECALCGSKEFLRFDHDHDSDELRSRLCQRDNTLVGYLEKTDPDILARALKYIGFT